jgi:hypothetical protein
MWSNNRAVICFIFRWTDIGSRPHVYGVLMILIFVLTLADGLCCAWFISHLVLVLVPGDRD